MAPSLLSAIFFCFTFIIFLKLTSAADHTLFNNQTLTIGQNLVSENQVFQLGFFHPGKSANVFLGIWYKATPHIVVWVANRHHPITVSQGVALSISRNGGLAICRGGAVLWSVNTSKAASRPIVRLLDTGNLVVTEELVAEGYIWQSFDNPTDTLLPGMNMVDDLDSGVKKNLISWKNSDDPSPGDFVVKIENEGLAELVIYKGTRKRLRTGKWNGLYFNGIPVVGRANSLNEFTFKGERLISMSLPYHSSIITRATLDPTGFVLRYIMNPRNDNWNIVYPFPRDLCDEYANCGPNAICTIEKAQRCECFRGFSPKFQNDWDLQDWSGGCVRVEPLDCEGGDGFMEVRGVKHPDMLRYWLNATMSIEDCKAECLKNCECIACADPYVRNGSTGCLMWYGDLLDTRVLPATDIKMQSIYVRVPVSELDFSSGLEEEEKKGRIDLILISIAAGVVVSSFINGGIVLLTRWKKQAAKRENEI